MSDALDQLAEEIATKAMEKLAPKLIEILRRNPVSNPLLSVSKAAKHLGVSEFTIRHLLEYGAIHRAEGLKEIRIRQSVLDEYATKPKEARK